MKNQREIPPDYYDESLFCTKGCEGFEEYKRGELSATKRKEVGLLRIEPGLAMLEVGLGRGEVLRACAQAGATATGIDYSDGALRVARKTLEDVPNVALQKADCRALPFPADSFDRVFAADVIEHLVFEDGVRMLREMHRVLKPGGLLVIHTAPNAIFSSYLYPLLKLFINRMAPEVIREMEMQRALARRLHVHEYSLISLRRAARMAGLHRAEVWIDEDLLRDSTHRFTQPLAASRLVRFFAAQGKNPFVRFFLGNDLYIRSSK